MGCQFGQGYLLAMPMDAQRAETLARIGPRTFPSLPRQSPEPGTPRSALTTAGANTRPRDGANQDSRAR